MTAWPASSQVCHVYIQIHSPPPACWTFCISGLTLYQTLSSQFIKPCTHSPGPVLSYRYPVPRLFTDPAFSDPPSSFHITDHILLYPRATLSYSIACRLIPRLPHPKLYPHIFQILVSSRIPFHVLSYPQTYCHLIALTLPIYCRYGPAFALLYPGPCFLALVSVLSYSRPYSPS